jgi:2',3'-cyclic-nucleotide 2'-phosphodiesterase
MVGDVVGKPGIQKVKKSLPRIVANHRIDFVTVNGENAAGGIGITPEIADELLKQDIDCITTGNHIWRQREIQAYINREKRLLRPDNFPSSQPGVGVGVYETAGGIRIGVVNLAGRVFMDPADSPFDAADRAIAALKEASVILVDFHAEATSEKKAMGLYLDGRVTAVVGTHTHVQTADEAVLEGGTAYITDLGMTGPHDSVIGMRKDLVLDRFVHGMPHAFRVAKQGVRFQGVIITADRATGRAKNIERIDVA